MEENKITKVLYNQVSLLIGIIGVVLSSYIFLTKPSNDSSVAIQLLEQRVTGQRTTIDELTKTQQNDLKETKNELSGLRNEIQVLTNSVVKLQTIIEERIPSQHK